MSDITSYQSSHYLFNVCIRINNLIYLSINRKYRYIGDNIFDFALVKGFFLDKVSLDTILVDSRKLDLVFLEHTYWVFLYMEDYNHNCLSYYSLL